VIYQLMTQQPETSNGTIKIVLKIKPDVEKVILT